VRAPIAEFEKEKINRAPRPHGLPHHSFHPLPHQPPSAPFSFPLTSDNRYFLFSLFFHFLMAVFTCFKLTDRKIQKKKEVIIERHLRRPPFGIGVICS
jgi:hypothetical protein